MDICAQGGGRTDKSARDHLGKRDAVRRSTKIDSAEGLWMGATTYMPFAKRPKTPFWVPSTLPVS
jgi:hypothetical protein